MFPRTTQKTTDYQENTKAKTKEHRLQEKGPHFTLQIDSTIEANKSIHRETKINEDAVRLNDRMLEIRAATVVCNHPQLGRYRASLQFFAKGGQLTLGGCIPSFYLKQLAQEALRSLEGVRRIENRIEVM